MYRVIQQERSVIWEVIISVIIRKRSLFEHVCTSVELLESPGLTPLDFSPWGMGGLGEGFG